MQQRVQRQPGSGHYHAGGMGVRTNDAASRGARFHEATADAEQRHAAGAYKTDDRASCAAPQDNAAGARGPLVQRIHSAVRAHITDRCAVFLLAAIGSGDDNGCARTPITPAGLRFAFFFFFFFLFIIIFFFFSLAARISGGRCARSGTSWALCWSILASRNASLEMGWLEPRL